MQHQKSNVTELALEKLKVFQHLPRATPVAMQRIHNSVQQRMTLPIQTKWEAQCECTVSDLILEPGPVLIRDPYQKVVYFKYNRLVVNFWVHNLFTSKFLACTATILKVNL